MEWVSGGVEPGQEWVGRVGRMIIVRREEFRTFYGGRRRMRTAGTCMVDLS